MLRKIVVAGVAGGFVAGLIVSLLQLILVEPLLLEAELYESGALVHFGAATDMAGADAAAANVTLGRYALTTLANMAAFAGFGLLLVAGFSLAERRGYEIDGRSGLLWGIGGFIAVQAAPAIGLPPELPGAAAADLLARQTWWTGTVVLTAGGVWIIAFARHWAPWVLGIMLIVAPHLIGAPHPDVFKGVAPPELATLFAGRSIGIGLVAWVCLGMITGHLWQRSAAPA